MKTPYIKIVYETVNILGVFYGYKLVEIKGYEKIEEFKQALTSHQRKLKIIK